MNSRHLPSAMIAQRTGRLYGVLWTKYDRSLFLDSVELFHKRWIANGEPENFFLHKRCLDAGCGSGRYAFAMAQLGAGSVVGVDVGRDGLEFARRCGVELDLPEVEFQQASVIDLPFPDGEFDFVCCSGVLHHTPSVERGLREIHRVLKPGGSAYLLLYGAGGLYWPLNLVTRPFARVLGYAEVDRCIAAARLPANKRRTILDDLFVPILETYSTERVDLLLAESGFVRCRRWTRGRLDHESDAASMIDELMIRVQLWSAGAESSTEERVTRMERHLTEMARAVVEHARELVRQQESGQLSQTELHDAVLGLGHHRLVVERESDDDSRL